MSYTLPQSAVEEALERIQDQQGVEGYVICNYDGVVLRRSATILKTNAEHIAQNMTKLAQSAKHASRDINPNDSFRNLRIKTTTKELILSADKDFLIVVIHEWTPAEDEF